METRRAEPLHCAEDPLHSRNYLIGFYSSALLVCVQLFHVSGETMGSGMLFHIAEAISRCTHTYSNFATHRAK